MTPQWLWLVRRLWRRVASSIYRARYALWVRDRKPSIAIGLALVCLIIGAATMVWGGSRYALSVLREVKYHEQIYHGHLIALANAEDEEGTITASLPTIEKITKLYPDHWLNETMVRWRKRVLTAQDVSGTLDQRSAEMAADGQYIRSVDLARASLDVWPESEQAAQTLAAFEEEIATHRLALTELFSACTSSGDPLNAGRSAWKFLATVPNVTDVEGIDEGDRARMRAQLCAQPLAATNVGDFVSMIEASIAGGED